MTQPSFPVALAAAFLLSAAPALADDKPLSIVASVTPAHSLAAMVAGDRAKVTLLVPAEISPHDFAMKPSSARALSESDLVVRIGAGLDEFLDSSIETLSEDAQVVTFGEAAGVALLPTRTETLWETHDDDHGEEHGDHHDDHAEHDGDHHDEHAKHDDDDHHDEHAKHDDDHHDEHAEHKEHDGHGHHDHHDHGPNDPHVWLDPENARAGLAAIAEALIKIDPAGADVYTANAAAADAKLSELQGRVAKRLNPVADKPYAVFHDAYQYLESRFGLTALGSISGIDGAAPSARRLREIQTAIREAEAICVFSEPQFDPGLVETVTAGTDAKGAVLDPLGAAIEPGPDHYIQMMDALADTLADCLG